MKTLGTLLTAVLILGGCQAKPAAPDDDQHLRQRLLTIQSVQIQSPPFDTIVIGDSLVERSVLDGLCGGSVLNAGVSAAKVEDLPKWMDATLEGERPRRVFLALGVNNTRVADGPQDVTEAYAAAVQKLKATGARVILTTIAPTTTERRNDVDEEAIERLNGFIRDLARREGLTVADVSAALKGPDGAALASDTADGLHLSAEGYSKWKATLQSTCQPDAPMGVHTTEGGRFGDPGMRLATR